MDWGSYLLFVLGCCLLAMSPGPDLLFVLSRSLTFGRAAGRLAATGILLGLLTHTLITLIGVAAILAASPKAFLALRYAGAAYLAWIALRMLTGKDDPLPTGEPGAPPSEAGLLVHLRQGYLINLLNPGAVLTFLAYIPHFVSATSAHRLQLLAFFSLSLCAIAFTWFFTVASISGGLTRWIHANPRRLVVSRIILGAFLLLFVLFLSIPPKTDL